MTPYYDDGRNSKEEDMAAMEGYHWRDGVYFNRLPDGSVTVRMMMSDDKYFDVGTIPPDEWASIVHAVAEPGSNYYTVKAAIEGRPDPLHRCPDVDGPERSPYFCRQCGVRGGCADTCGKRDMVLV